MKASGVVSEKGESGRLKVVARLAQSRMALSAKAWGKLGLGSNTPDFGLELGNSKKLGAVNLKFDAFAKRVNHKESLGLRTGLRGGSDGLFLEGSGEVRYAPGSGRVETKVLVNVGFSF